MTSKNEPDRVLTTAEAADYMAKPGETLSLAGMRSLARFARRRGYELLAPEDQWPDRRTRMYSLQRLREYKVAREKRDWKIPVEEQNQEAERRKKELEKQRKAEKAAAKREEAKLRAQIRKEVEAELRAEYEAKLAKQK